MENEELPGLKTTVRVYKGSQGKGEARLLGFAELVIGGAFVIKDIRIVEAASGPAAGRAFVSFPSRRGSGESDGRYFDVAHPITSLAHRSATEMILDAYERARAAA